MTDEQSIAIVGMAVNIPHARTLEEFWTNLVEGRSCIDRFDDSPAEASQLDSLFLQHGERVLAGGILDDPFLFDSEFFEFSQLDAEITDPQHRLMLEVAKEALENASVPQSYLKDTGVFAGCAASSYLHNNLLPREDVIAQVGAYGLTLANDKDFLSTRLSYKLGLGGPSLTVQTACSTSLVAAHLAVQSLLAGDCDTAIVGGVSLRIPQKRGYLYQVDGVMAPDGVCRPFDHKASGFVPSNGAVALVLRRLDSALSDRDPIRAVIRSSAVKNDGADRPSFAAPGLGGQIATLSEALAVADLDPRDISLIETHGTATKLGDQVEFEAINTVYGDAKAPCYIGAVKSCTGHLDTAAGALGLVKTALSMERGLIPPILNFEAPNPGLGVEGTRFRLPTSPVKWERGKAPRHAGVTSLGLGGTNAHVIMSEAPLPANNANPLRSRIFVTSAKSAAALEKRCDSLRETIEQGDAAQRANLAFALATGAKPYSTRGAYLLDHTASRGNDAQAKRLVAGACETLTPPRIAFVFPGGGAAFAEMVEGLCEAEPVFATELETVISRVQNLSQLNLRAAIFMSKDEAGEAFQKPSVSLPAMFCIQVAVARTLQAFGVVPDAVIGHSAGEYAAAVIAGVLSVEDAAKLALLRANRFEDMPEGVMVNVNLPADQISQHIPAESHIEISVINTPDDTVLGGPAKEMADFITYLDAADITFAKIAIKVAAHTALVAPISEELDALERTMDCTAPAIPMISNVTGRWIDESDLRAGYWGKHLRACVRFKDGLDSLIEDGVTQFLDIGPGQSMAGIVQRMQGASHRVQAHTVCRSHHFVQSSSAALAEGLAGLWCTGVAVDWDKYYAAETLRRTAVPPHPLTRRRHVIESPASTRAEVKRAVSDFLWRPTLDAVQPRDAIVHPQRWHVFCDDASVSKALEAEFDRVEIDTRMHVLCPEVSWHDALEGDAKDGPVDGVLVVWAAPSIRSGPAYYHEVCDLARAIAKGKIQGVPRILIASRGAILADQTATSTPSMAMASSVTRVVQNEQPDIDCQSLEITADADDAELASIIRERLQHVMPDHLFHVGGRFSQEVYKPYPRAECKSEYPKKGVWIITGGLGAIGRTLAVHLAKQSQARLVFVSRTSPDTSAPLAALKDEERQRVEALRAINAAGGQWEVVMGDIAEPETALKAVEKAYSAFGAIHGVIHAAGVPAGGLLQLRSREDADAVFKPKIEGLNSLRSALPEPVDTLILCSALDSVLGTAGQSDHCAANAHMDALALLGDPMAHRTVSINWSAWRDIGQAAVADVPAPLRVWREKALASGLRADEGADVFDAVLAGESRRVVVSVSEIAELKDMARQALSGASPERSLEAEDGVAAGETLQTTTEIRIAGLWSGLLNASRLEVDSDFFELGGHSLAAMQLVSRLREAFAVPVRLQELMACTTIGAQAEYIDLLLVQQIESLSDEEVETLLSSS
ncbi:type I polyketide synthase [Roseovarius sp. M141]|uniref:SDR family NAD(P)-dependent oxidoreductase n=1 Tax=Roseovarius sp. M141 TaxID=2583806 RepID=UPI0020CFE5DD|nr:KR domain-containing protein [Roseovarius sp. M141]